MENATFPYKTALQEATVKENRLESKKNKTITKSRVLPITTFLKEKNFAFSVRSS